MSTPNPLINNTYIQHPDHCGEFTIDSFSLSRLTQQRHQEMKHDIEEACGPNGLDLDLNDYSCDHYIEGKLRTCYVLTRSMLDEVLPNYDERKQASVLRQWHRVIHTAQWVKARRKLAETERELEAHHKANPWVPKNLIEALQLCADLAHKNDALEIKWANGVELLARANETIGRLRFQLHALGGEQNDETLID